MLFSLGRFSLDLVGLSTIFSQRPQQIGENPACRGSASGEFILPAVPDAARTAVVDRRQLTGKMKSPALEKNTTGSASPRRTIVLSLTTASSVILVLKETEAAKADAGLGRFWALGQIRAWTRPRRVLDLDAPLT